MRCSKNPGVLSCKGDYSAPVLRGDAGHNESAYTTVYSSRNDPGEVVLEEGDIKVAVGIDHHMVKIK